VTTNDLDDALDKCRHGKTAAEFCEACDNERIDLSTDLSAADDLDLRSSEQRVDLTADETAPRPTQP
jgi:hypothetical protein